jgi:ATP-binding cassette subfamily B protein
MVFQDVYLFNDTVLNNIRVGKLEATEAEIVAAAKAARCHDFVSKLPEGYETMVGEGGSTLSGGEKQRISIARAMLKDAPIVLLDEATASLDPENELYIQQAIDSLLQEKTVIVIAHRLNTVVHADKIVVLDEGRIVEQGTHDELMSAGGLYRRMWDEQQKVRHWKFGEGLAPEITLAQQPAPIGAAD